MPPGQHQACYGTEGHPQSRRRPPDRRCRRHPKREGKGKVKQRFNATLVRTDGLPFAALAQREGVSRSYFTRLVRLSYLAPDITQAILDRRQPRDLTAERLLEHSRLPLAWRDQRIVLGLA
jgi:AraC-like DNA-binding protein